MTGSTQYGRALAEPDEVPQAIRYYEQLRREADVVYRVSPYAPGGKPARFSFDYSFNYWPLAYERPGPEVGSTACRGCKGTVRALIVDCFGRDRPPTTDRALSPARSSWPSGGAGA